ncbi:MAG: sugar ABC transporter permease, partial [Actinomycetota bacterium]
LIGLGVGALLGLIWGTLFAERIPVDTSILVLWNAVTGAILCGALGFAIGTVDDGRTRAIIGTAGGAAIGLLLGGMLFNVHQPRLETVPLIVSPIVVGAIGVGINVLRGRNLVTGAATGALIGWLLGTFGFPTLGGGPEIETLTATTVAGGLAGLRYGAKPYLDAVGRVNLEQKSRGVIFLMPALGFIATGLVIPLLKTAFLSIKDERSETFVWLENYQSIFTDPRSFDYTGRLNLFGSVLFWVAAVLLVIAVGVGYRAARTSGNSLESSRLLVRTIGGLLALVGLLEYVIGRQTADDEEQLGANVVVIVALLVIGAALFLWSYRPGGSGGSALDRGLKVDMGGTPGAIAIAGMFILSLAVFSTLRGTLFNNLWWVVTVVALSAGLGLVVAVLADRASYESVAKSFVFMPLAISFVGAGIIWRFMYIARDESKDQTGVMNFLWVELGRISTGGVGRVIGIIVLLAIIGGLGMLATSAMRADAQNTALSSSILVLPFAWALWRFTGGGGMGGTGVEAANGIIQETTIQFLPDNQPFNNLWLMLVLIWIQTGFAMVIFSAAIKAVDSSLIEAAKIDGANDSQVFWRVTVPQILPTIGVVVTTLIVVVMKVFDIVKVMTNGNFDTQVVANEMWQRAFTELNFGLGSALAIVLFLAVVPVMAYNIRTMQREL